MEAFLGQLALPLRNINIAQFENTAFFVSALQVFHRDVQQAGCQQRPHDRKLRGDGVHQPDHIPFRRVWGNMQGIQITVGIECQSGYFTVSLGAHDALDLFSAKLVRGSSSARDRGVFQESGYHVLIAVFTDDLLRQIRLAHLDILPVARRGHVEYVSVPLHFKAQAFQNTQHVFRRDFNAEDPVDPAQAGVKFLPFTGCARADVKGAGCHFPAAQFLDQVQGSCHAQLGSVFTDPLLKPRG